MIDHLDFEWSKIAGNINSLEKFRLLKTLELLPPNLHTVLDAGCGDGRLTNLLAKRYSHVCGLDISQEALSHLQTERKLGSIADMPFQDKAFELSICTEVLEHLPFNDYSQALKELARVTRWYIFLSFPNSENLRKGRVVCPYCGCRFHSDWHVRRFTPDTLPELPGFKIRNCVPIIEAYSYPDFVFYTVYALGRVFGGDFPATTICPQCGYSKGKEHPLKTPATLKTLSIIPKITKYQWLTALYERD